jgi:hypothetical protein
MNLDDLADELPNGFHDALLRAYSSDPAAQRAEFLLDVWIGDLHSDRSKERERRCRARLEFLGLAYLIVDSSDPRYPATNESPLQIDACTADDNPDLARAVPPGGFAGRFFVTEWNAFIHFAALEARLTWLGAN